MELDEYRDWLLGRSWPRNQSLGVGAYHDVAVAVFGRCKEMEILILRQESDGELPKGSALGKFRTGELRSFLELCSKCVDRGSREITEAQIVLEATRAGI